MITFFAVICGILAIRRLPVDLYPDVSYPVLSVTANLPGAAPEEVEDLLTRPIEDVLSGISGVASMRSITRESRVNVNLEFGADSDMAYQEMQVRAKIASIRNRLPDGLDEPTIQRQDPDDTPIIELALSGSQSISELSTFAKDEIVEKLRQIPGVGEVTLSGERTREIIVAMKPEALEDFKVSADEIIKTLGDFIGQEPIGRLEGRDRLWTLRAESSVKDLWSLGEVPVVQTAEGFSVPLKELANISLGFNQVRRINRLATKDTLAQSLTIEIKKQSGQNTVAISDSVTKAVAELRKTLPPNANLLIANDNAELIRTNIADVLETLVIGSVLTILVVLLFLHSPRATLTTGLSLPSSVLTTFAAMAIFGFTINVMTLLSLSLAIGLLVDDAIVVRENIFRKLQEFPDKPLKAALLGTREVSLAVIATTLTIVAVFLPVGMMGGTSGQFFAQFAVTVVFAIVISLWDALTMAPLLSAYFANIADPAKEWTWSKIPSWTLLPALGRGIYALLMKFEHGFLGLESSYRRCLAWLLPRPWWPILGIVAVAAATVFSFTKLPKSFLPSQLGLVFSAALNGPLALPVPKVAETGLLVVEKLRKVEGLDYWTIGSGLGFLGNAQINLTIRVKPEFGKNQKSLAKIRSEVRSTLNSFVGYTVRLSEPADPLAGNSGRFQPVAVLISGDDNSTLKLLARQVQGMMREIKGMTDILPLNDEGLPEYQLTMPALKAGFYGFSPKNLNAQLRTWVEGNTSFFLKMGNEQVPIRVLLEGGRTLTLDQLKSLSINLQTTPKSPVQVPLESLLEVDAGAGPAQIARENRQKILRVGSGLEPGAALGDVVKSLQTKLNEFSWPKGTKARIVGQSEQMDELFSNVSFALALGCLFMYMVLASLYESFLIPLVVMLAVPLAATGAILALISFGMPLDLYSGIALVLLAGIVAKNSILLVDFAMEEVRQGAHPKEALLKAAPMRLRPILMTSIAMIVGMLPVATGLGVGGAARQGLGIATIGGIISSTILTLLIVPNFFLMVSHLAKLKSHSLDDSF